MESVEQLISMGPDHASLYLLELYPNAPLREEMARGSWEQAPDEAAVEMYHCGLAALEDAGYRQYEISNVARHDYRSRHNLKYWSGGEWLGFGCGAHSTRGRRRWQNVSDIGDYAARMKAGEAVVGSSRELSDEERLTDTMFLGLRLVEGIDLDLIEVRFGQDPWDRWGSELEPFVAAGLLVREERRLRLTREGMLLANEIMQVFV